MNDYQTPHSPTGNDRLGPSARRAVGPSDFQGRYGLRMYLMGLKYMRLSPDSLHIDRRLVMNHRLALMDSIFTNLAIARLAIRIIHLRRPENITIQPISPMATMPETFQCYSQITVWPGSPFLPINFGWPIL